MELFLWDFHFSRFFNTKEFASPDDPESGINMDYNFMLKIMSLRCFVNRPFVINSGFRTKEHNQSLIARGYEASPDSAHLKGLAVDIKITDSSFLYGIIKYALFLKFKRIGIAKTFIHLDMDEGLNKPQEVIWLYE